MPYMVDNAFGINGNNKLRLTSSYFYTKPMLDSDGDEVLDDKVVDLKDSFDEADGTTVRGVYDTVEETINTRHVDALTVSDMGLVSSKINSCSSLHYLL